MVSVGTSLLLDATDNIHDLLSGASSTGSPGEVPHVQPQGRVLAASCTWTVYMRQGPVFVLAAGSPRSYFLVGLSLASGFPRLVPFVLRDAHCSALAGKSMAVARLLYHIPYISISLVVDYLNH